MLLDEEGQQIQLEFFSNVGLLLAVTIKAFFLEQIVLSHAHLRVHYLPWHLKQGGRGMKGEPQVQLQP